MNDRELLKKILDTLNTIPNARTPRKYKHDGVFEDTYEICAVIGE